MNRTALARVRAGLVSWGLAVLAGAALVACGGSDPAASTNGAPSNGSPSSPPSADTYTPLSWASPEPVTQYALADGTKVTRVGGRVRDRHAREQADQDGSDLYGLFAPHYFERRTHDITIYENVSPTNPENRILTLVVRPQWHWYGTNFRHGYIGRRDNDPMGPAAVALYADNGGMKLLPEGTLLAGQELKTPLANYDSLPGDGPAREDLNLDVPLRDGEFVLVKQITHSATARRALQPGDLVEFELGIFLSGKKDDNLGRFNYYADAMVYEVGTGGLKPWYRGPCCSTTAIPWDSRPLPVEALSGGAMMTYHEDTSYQPEMSLMQAGTNIAGRNIQPFVEGRRLFHTSFLTGTHSESGNGTLFLGQAGKAGPRFQQSACIQCHVNNGKSSPEQGKPLSTLLVLTGDNDAAGKLVADARFGGRLSQGLLTEQGKTFDGRQAVLSVAAWTDQPGRYPDGAAYTLQTPTYVLKDTAGKALDLPPRLSVRTAPHMVGMGLLEAVPESALSALATASRNDPDGAVGRLQLIPDLRNPALRRVGRFGWRGTSATVEEQTMVALNADMGVTTSGLPNHFCGKATTGTECRTADAGGPELRDSEVDLLVKYTSLLSVPAQRHFPGQQPLGTAAPVILSQGAAATAAQEQAEAGTQARVTAGRRLFQQARCTACHTATLQTGTAHRLAELRGQTIRPYTDLLLHDMGPALGDNFPQGVASGQEWRTAPLWGLGVLKQINPGTRYLHDGRARTVEEAILWHGGQGQASRDRFKALPAADRARLIEFVNSL